MNINSLMNLFSILSLEKAKEGGFVEGEEGAKSQFSRILEDSNRVSSEGEKIVDKNKLLNFPQKKARGRDKESFEQIVMEPIPLLPQEVPIIDLDKSPVGEVAKESFDVLEDFNNLKVSEGRRKEEPPIPMDLKTRLSSKDHLVHFVEFDNNPRFRKNDTNVLYQSKSSLNADEYRGRVRERDISKKLGRENIDVQAKTMFLRGSAKKRPFINGKRDKLRVPSRPLKLNSWHQLDPIKEQGVIKPHVLDVDSRENFVRGERPHVLDVDSRENFVRGERPNVLDVDSRENFVGGKRPNVLDVDSRENFVGGERPHVLDVNARENFVRGERPNVLDINSRENFVRGERPNVLDVNARENFVRGERPNVLDVNSRENFVRGERPNVLDVNSRENFVRGERPNVLDVNSRENFVRGERPNVLDVDSRENFVRGERPRPQQKVTRPYVLEREIPRMSSPQPQSLLTSNSLREVKVERDSLEISSPSPSPSLNSLSQSVGPKVLNLTQGEFVDSKDIIQEIVKYIEVKRLAKMGKFDVIVQHKDLGRFELSVIKNEGNIIDINITAESSKGHQFFVENEVELSRALERVGAKFGDLKLVEIQGAVIKNDFLGNREEGGGQKSDAFSKFEHHEDADSRRRRQLWEEYRQHYESA